MSNRHSPQHLAPRFTRGSLSRTTLPLRGAPESQQPPRRTDAHASTRIQRMQNKPNITMGNIRPGELNAAPIAQNKAKQTQSRGSIQNSSDHPTSVDAYASTPDPSMQIKANITIGKMRDHRKVPTRTHLLETQTCKTNPISKIPIHRGAPSKVDSVSS